jgi:hypothetical protein
MSQSTTVLALAFFDDLQPSAKIIAFEDRWDFVGHVDKSRYQAVEAVLNDRPCQDRLLAKAPAVKAE